MKKRMLYVRGFSGPVAPIPPDALGRRSFSALRRSFSLRRAVGSPHRHLRNDPMSELLVYVGTYTERTPDGSGSKGIYAARFDTTTGKLSGLTAAAELQNPSWVTVSGDRRFLYAVSEVGVADATGKPAGLVVAYSIGGDGALTELNRVSSGGADPCHLAVDRTGRTVAVANYTGGSTAAFHVGTDGRLGAASKDQHVGKGPNAERQEAPHAHSVNFVADDRLLLSCDLGNDRVYVYRHDPRTGAIAAHKPAFVGLEPGAGPRHLALHPSKRYVYVLTELTSHVAMFAWNPSAGTLVQRQSVSTVPLGTTPSNSTAEIVVHPNGRVVYASNRGHDSIAVFSVDARSGRLTLLANTPTGGNVPRNFAVDASGHWLLAANQRSNSIVTFAIDPTKGTLTPNGATLTVPRPVCVAFAPDAGAKAIPR
jgi:6-phosphogluconolactonase